VRSSTKGLPSQLTTLIDRLQDEQHLEMMRLMAAHPQEGTAWEDAYDKLRRAPKRCGLGLNGESYALVVLDVWSNLGAVINTRT
jgi:hypothetical protein